MLEPELAQRNMRLGWILFGACVAVFGAAIVVALLYLQLD